MVGHHLLWGLAQLQVLRNGTMVGRVAAMGGVPEVVGAENTDVERVFFSFFCSSGIKGRSVRDLCTLVE